MDASTRLYFLSFSHVVQDFTTLNERPMPVVRGGPVAGSSNDFNGLRAQMPGDYGAGLGRTPRGPNNRRP